MSATDEVKKPLSVQVALDFPVMVNGVEYTDLVVRRPKGRDRLVASKVSGGEIEQEYTYLSTLCDVPVEVFYEMDWVDIDRVTEKVNGFKSMPTVPTP